MIASQTGIVAGAVASLIVVITKTRARWIVSIVLGTATAIEDFFVHPGQFGPIAAEAAVTGLGAGLLSYQAGTAVAHIRSRYGARIEMS